MRRPNRPIAVAHATRQRALGVGALIGVLGLYAAMALAPFVLPAVADIGAIEAFRATLLAVALVHGVFAVVLLR